MQASSCNTNGTASRINPACVVSETGTQRKSIPRCTTDAMANPDMPIVRGLPIGRRKTCARGCSINAPIPRQSARHGAPSAGLA
jgi:hypothetical protein